MKPQRTPITGRLAVLAAVAMIMATSCGSSADETARDTAAPTATASTSDPTEDTPVSDRANDITPAQTQSDPVASAVADAIEPATDDSTDSESTAPSTPSVAVENQDAVEDQTVGEQNLGDQPSASCRRITDFDGGADDANWVIVNDGVMGGRSNGAVEISNSVMRFTGGVVTAGGGFTSVRFRLAGGEMADSASLRLRMRADERVYGVTLEDNAEVGRRSVSHRADFNTGRSTDSDGWAEVTLDYSVLTPSVFGQFVEAPAFDPAFAREIGIIIADGVDGDFALEIDWIDVCR